MSVHIKAGTGFASGKDAGKKAALQALKNAGVKECNFVVVYSSPSLNLKEVVKQVSDVTENAPLFGCTSAGNITEKGLWENSVSVMVVNSSYFRVGVGIGENVRKEPVEAGRKAARQASALLKNDPRIRSLAMFQKPAGEYARLPPFIALTAIDGLSGQEERVLEGIQEGLGFSPIFGGSAGDDLNLKQTMVFCNGEIYSDAVTVALISTDFYTQIGSSHGWVTSNKSVVVTKAKGRKVIEFNGRPAAEEYSRMLGKSQNELIKERNIAFGTGLKYPFGVQDITGKIWLRHPFRVNKDGSIDFFAAIPEKTVLLLMEGTPEGLLHAGSQLAEDVTAELNGKPAVAFVFNCVARKVFLGEKAAEEIRSIYNTVKCPMIGFYTYGEQSPTGSGMSYHKNQTINLLLVSDKLITG